MNNTLSALRGVSVGHSTHPETLTGCTVILFDDPCPAAVEIHGQSPATYNTQRLDLLSTDYYVDGLFVAGGSQPGVAATAHGLAQALIEAGKPNPSVSGAGIYDLELLRGKGSTSNMHERLIAARQTNRLRLAMKGQAQEDRSESFTTWRVAQKSEP